MYIREEKKKEAATLEIASSLRPCMTDDGLIKFRGISPLSVIITFSTAISTIFSLVLWGE